MATQKTKDYNGIASLIKWGVIGTLGLVGVGSGAYYFIHKASQDNKKDSEYSSTTAVDSKGKTTVSTIGTGKTPSAYASLLHSALTATTWGVPDSNEDGIYAILNELKSQYEVALISKSYETLFQKTLSEALTNDLDDDEYSKCINIVTSKPLK